MELERVTQLAFEVVPFGVFVVEWILIVTGVLELVQAHGVRRAGYEPGAREVVETVALFVLPPRIAKVQVPSFFVEAEACHGRGPSELQVLHILVVVVVLLRGRCFTLALPTFSGLFHFEG